MQGDMARQMREIKTRGRVGKEREKRNRKALHQEMEDRGKRKEEGGREDVCCWINYQDEKSKDVNQNWFIDNT